MSHKPNLEDLLTHSFWVNRADMEWFAFSDQLIKENRSSNVRRCMIANRLCYWVWMDYYKLRTKNFQAPKDEILSVHPEKLFRLLTSEVPILIEIIGAALEINRFGRFILRTYYIGLNEETLPSILEKSPHNPELPILPDQELFLEEHFIYNRIASIYSEIIYDLAPKATAPF